MRRIEKHDAGANLARLLDAVASGDSGKITADGRVVAILTAAGATARGE